MFIPIVITFQGVILALGVLVAAFIVWKKGIEENFDEEQILDGLFLSVFTGILTSRIFYGLIHWERFSKSVFSLIDFSRFPGFSTFGFLLGSFFFLFILSLQKKWDYFKMMDVFIFGFLLGGIFVRLSNLVAGNFYGKIALYEFFFLLFLFWTLNWLANQYRLFSWYQDKKGEAKEGFLFSVFLISYGIFQFLLEFLGQRQLYFKGLSFEQTVSLGFVLSGILFIWFRSGRKLPNLKSEIFNRLPSLPRWEKKKKFFPKVGREAR